MPLYEYYCEDCEGVFELLRPARESSLDQPCPVCDEDARRIVSKEWSAFIFREGLPRRLPDDGSYRHLGKKVSKPITGSVQPGRHPELHPPGRDLKAPTIEEIEQYEFRQEVKRQLERESLSNVINESVEQRDRQLIKRMTKTRGSDKEQQIKRQVLQREQIRQRQFAQEQARIKQAAKSTKKRSDD
jgi:putative FmdB family regulatory protein